MNLKFVSACLVLLALHCQAAAGQDTPKTQVSFERLVDRVKSGDQSVDFRQLRLSYPNSITYKTAPDTAAQKKAMMAALNSKDYQNAIKNADVVLTSNYVDMDAHFVESVANRELHVTDKAEFHKFVLQSLLKSISDFGDGKTIETAFQVIDVHEEYVMLRFMGVGLPESQSLLHKDGHSFDEIKFKDPRTHESVTRYFNVDIPVKRGL